MDACTASHCRARLPRLAARRWAARCWGAPRTVPPATLCVALRSPAARLRAVIEPPAPQCCWTWDSNTSPTILPHPARPTGLHGFRRLGARVCLLSFLPQAHLPHARGHLGHVSLGRREAAEAGAWCSARAAAGARMYSSALLVWPPPPARRPNNCTVACKSSFAKYEVSLCVHAAAASTAAAGGDAAQRSANVATRLPLLLLLRNTFRWRSPAMVRAAYQGG